MSGPGRYGAGPVAFLLAVGLLLGASGPGPLSRGPSEIPVAGPDVGPRALIGAPVPGAPPLIGVVEQTVSTTSDALSPGNNPNTLNPRGPQILAYDPGNGKLFVAYDPIPVSGFGPGYAGGVAAINGSTGRLLGDIAVGLQPEDVLYDPDNGFVYAVDWRSAQVLVIDPNTDSLLTSIGTGDTTDPVAIALDPIDGRLFVTESSDPGGVMVINGTSNQEEGFLADADGPWWDLYDPANGDLYVENWGGDNLTVFNATSEAPVASVNLTNGLPTGATGPMAYAPSDRDVFVPVLDQAAVIVGPNNTVVGTVPAPPDSGGYWGFADNPDDHGGVVLASVWGGNRVSVLNASADPTVIASLPVGGWAEGAIVAGAPASVLVASWDSDNLTRFNASTLAPIVPFRLSTSPSAAAYDPDTATMDVALADADQVVEVNISSARFERSIPVGSDPDALVFDPVDGEVYVANGGSNTVSVLNATGLVGTVPVGADPTALALDPSSGNVYVASLGNSTLTVVSGGHAVATFPVGNDSGPVDLAFDPSTSRLFVVNSNWGNVSEYDPASGSLLGSFPVGQGLDGLALAPGNQQLFAVDYANDTVSVASAASLGNVTILPVGSGPSAITYDPANGLVYAANENDNDLTVIDPATDAVLGTLPVGYDPVGLAPDGPLGALYVVNQLSGSLSVVATGSNEVAVQFVETGLPTESPWSVDLAGTIARTTAPTLTFYASNGSYGFTVAGPAGYTPRPAEGSVSVAGVGLTEPVAFEANTTPVASRAGAAGPGVTEPALVAAAVGLLALVSVIGAREIHRRRRRPTSGGTASDLSKGGWSERPAAA